MPIFQHFIDELLDRVDIVEVIDKSINSKKQANFSAGCSFHDEKTPSFMLIQINSFFIVLDVVLVVLMVLLWIMRRIFHLQLKHLQAMLV